LTSLLTQVNKYTFCNGIKLVWSLNLKGQR